MMSLFISLEGIDGSGKTSQVFRICHYLSERGLKTKATHEPGGTKFGQELRKLILSQDYKHVHPLSQLLCYFSDRIEHLKTIIEPSLEQKIAVVSDRYLDSTYAYQVFAQGIEASVYEQLCSILNPLIPTKTFLLDIDPEEGLKRVSQRSKPYSSMEVQALSFHKNVQKGYQELAQKYPHRIKLISVQNKSEETVFDEIKEELDKIVQ